LQPLAGPDPLSCSRLEFRIINAEKDAREKCIVFIDIIY